MPGSSSFRIWGWVCLCAAAACSLQAPSEDDAFAAGSAAERGGTAGVGAAGAGTTAGVGGSTPNAGSGGSDNGGSDNGGSDNGGSDNGGSDNGGSDSGGSSNGGSDSGGSDSGGSSNGGSSNAGSANGGSSAALGGSAGSGGAQPFDPDAGLVAHFPFDETDGEVAANVKDPTKNGAYLGTCLHPEGKIGNAVSIRNSATATIDYIELPPGILSELSATTVALWGRTLSPTRQGGRLFEFSLEGAGAIYFSPDDLHPETQAAGAHLGGARASATFVDLWTPSLFTDMEWHHVAVAWSADGIDLYVDGEAQGTQATPGAVPSDLGATSPNWLGRSANDAFIALYAQIDDLRIYDRALTAAEIAELFEL